MWRGGRGRSVALATFILFLGLGGLAMLALRFDMLPVRISDFWPVNLAEPGGWLLDRRLADLRQDPALCRRVLTTPHIVASPVADRAETSKCGWSNAFRLSAAGRAKLEVGAVTCELAASVALWIEHVVQPAANRHFGRSVTEIEHLGAYACRNIRGSPDTDDTPSEHATANALDIQGFRIADGRRIKVVTHWGGNGAEGRFLAEVHKGGCRYFRVSIGPAYNAAHRDHFHLDRGRWRKCR